jgi:sterol desaturase/sphingolipid hydroxylase (fatty acid hydroxylase superfamily)
MAAHIFRAARGRRQLKAPMMKHAGATVKRERLTPGAFFRTYWGRFTVRLYLLLGLLSSAATLIEWGPRLPVISGVAVLLVTYPFIEYGLHRFVFHSAYLYRSPLTAGLWKRIHYDHHLHPEDGGLIFGPAEMMIPAALAVTVPLGWLAGGGAGAAGAASAGIWILAVYELFHGAAHLPVQPRTAYGGMLKRMHMLHHFHNEHGNYGVTTPLCDVIFGTYYRDPGKVGRSPTVRNLGYTEAEAARFPWVARLAATPPAEGGGKP